MRELIHFAHGNGFPSLCYKQFLQQFETEYDCCYIDKIGHDPRFPVTENWLRLVDELIDSVRSQAQRPLIGMGHSLGGVLTFLAAIKEPQLFKVIVLIDAPILNRLKSKAIRLAKIMGAIDRLTPAFRTRARKSHWESREQLIAYLQSRDLFSTFTKECLEDYITYGCECDAHGCSLRFDKQVEYDIFRTIPHHLYHYEGSLTIPCYLFYGEKSKTVDPIDRRYMKKHYAVHAYKMPGTHMLPMEYPEQLARKIMDVLS